MSQYIVAIDVGGTFTDLICYDAKTNEISTEKVPSTPPDFIDGMIDGIASLGIGPKDIRPSKSARRSRPTRSSCVRVPARRW